MAEDRAIKRLVTNRGEKEMRYYSEDTVRDIIKIMAHSFLEEGKTFADTLLKNQPSVVINEPHGRCVDADAILSQCKYWSLSRGDKYFEIRISNEIVKAFLKDALTVLEATKEE